MIGIDCGMIWIDNLNQRAKNKKQKAKISSGIICSKLIMNLE